MMLCLDFTGAARASEENSSQQASAMAAQAYVNKLGPGNKVKLIVFGEDDLSGEFEVDNTGNLSLPLIGNIQVAGIEVRALEKMITDKLSEGYLINPRVNLEVLNYKPIFILGEVNKPGSYPYTNGLTVINAVALGGGYTNRARTSSVDIVREQDGKKVEIEGDDTTLVYPGDTIQVDERLF